MKPLLTSGVLALFFCPYVTASSAVEELWREVAFSTDGGGSVAIKASEEGDVILVEVSLRGERVPMTPQCLRGLSHPVLAKTSLARSFSSVEGSPAVLTTLEFPIFDPKSDLQGAEEMQIVSFVFDGARTERTLWSSSEKKQRISKEVCAEK